MSFNIYLKIQEWDFSSRSFCYYLLNETLYRIVFKCQDSYCYELVAVK